jgi:cytochrome c-type biogenesis protein CcmH
MRGASWWWIVVVVLAALAVASAGVVLMRRQKRETGDRRRATDALRAELRSAKERLERGEIDVATYEGERRRLVASLLEHTSARGRAHGTRSILLGVCGGVLVGVVVLAYVFRGPLFSRTAPTAAEAEAGPPRAPLSDDQLGRMVSSAEERTRRDPRDVEAWALLAHSLDMMGKFAESSRAYAKLVELRPRDAQALADYADALAVANGRRFEGQPTELIERALALDAHNAKALALAGSAAYERGAWRDAAQYWTRAHDATSDPRFRADLTASLRQARVQLGEEKPTQASTPKAAGAASTVSGRLMIADELARTLPPDAAVFVFARPADGSRMPVAIIKRQVRDLPFSFTLDDATSMVPGMKLSQQSMVVVGARVSRDGDVVPKPGDAEGWSAPVPVGASGVRLEISERLK